MPDRINNNNTNISRQYQPSGVVNLRREYDDILYSDSNSSILNSIANNSINDYQPSGTVNISISDNKLEHEKIKKIRKEIRKKELEVKDFNKFEKDQETEV